MSKILPDTGFNFIKTADRLINHSLDAVVAWDKDLGGLYKINLGPMQHLIAVTDLDKVQKMLVTESKKYKRSVLYNHLGLLLGKGLVTNEGDHWLKQRRLAQPAFHKKYLENIFRLMQVQIDLHLEQLAEKSGEEINWDDEMVRVTMQVVVNVLLGSSLEGDSERFSYASQVGLEHAMNLWKNPLYKYTQHLNGKKKSFEREKVFLDELVRRFIEERRKTGNEDKFDLLAMFMEARDEDSGESMDDQQLLDEVLTMFVAGHETSAHALSWGILQLKKHPEMMEKIRQEAEEVLGDAPPTFDKIMALTYTRAVVDEILRFYPSAWTVSRSNVDTVEFDGITFPPDTQFMIPIHAIHHSERYWEQPEKFMPERFMQGPFKGEEKLKYIPFGAGPRMCIGWNFALVEMAAILALTLRRFDLQVLTDKVRYEAAITVRPVDHIKVRIKQRTQAPAAPAEALAHKPVEGFAGRCPFSGAPGVAVAQGIQQH